MIKFKNGVEGFMFNSHDEWIVEVYNEFISDQEVEVFNKFGVDCMIISNRELERVIDLFGIEGESDLQFAGLNKVLEIV